MEKMTCPNCQGKTGTHITGNIGIEFCVHCWDFIRLKECQDHQPILVRYLHSNNTIHIRTQCMSCGKLDSKYHSKDSVSNWENLPLADMTRAYPENNPEIGKIQEIFKRYETKRKEHQRLQDFDRFLAEHNEYLRSDDWKKRRLLVLKRDNYLCQSCLENPATEVHHKSYRYWKNEPLFELASVCTPCHEAFTDMNRNVVDFKKILLKE